MAEITTTQSFADGDTVTAAKLNNIIANASVGSDVITNRSDLPSVDGASDFVLGYDTSSSTLRKIRPNNLINDGVITSSKISDLSVITSKLGDGSVTTAKIADLSVTSDKIEGTSIISSKLADNSVITIKIANNAVTSAKIEGSSITSEKIVDGAVTQSKLQTVFVEGTTTIEGTYGSADNIPIISIDSKGRVISASSATSSTDVRVSRFVEGTNGGGYYYDYDQSVVFLDSNNQIRVAGVALYGKLGTGAELSNTNSTGYLIALAPLSSGETISKIYVGEYALYALSSLGKLYSCGLNDRGQLGHSATTNVSILTEITGISNVADFSPTIGGLGFDHCLACTTSGALYSWGYNGYGQCGDTTLVNITNGPKLITQGSISGKIIRKVYAFGLFSYVIDSNNDVHSCGRNGVGQLGLGDTADRSSFVQVGGRKADAVFGQGGNTTYLTGNAWILYQGQVWATGFNTAGTLGVGDTVNKSAFTQISGLTSVSCMAVSHGYADAGSSVAALRSDGSIRVWGLNAQGQLGLGNILNQTSPQTPTGISGISFVKVLFNGSNSTNTNLFALSSSGRLYACGYGGRLLGNGSTSVTNVTSLTAVRQQNVTFDDFTVMGGGSANGIAMAKTPSGQLYCWGNNAQFQCGVGGGAAISLPQRSQIRY